MPSSDMSKCDGAWRKEVPAGGWEIKTCPLRDSCLRYTLIGETFWQSYIEARYDEKTGRCWNYVNNEEEKKS